MYSVLSVFEVCLSHRVSFLLTSIQPEILCLFVFSAGCRIKMLLHQNKCWYCRCERSAVWRRRWRVFRRISEASVCQRGFLWRGSSTLLGDQDGADTHTLADNDRAKDGQEAMEEGRKAVWQKNIHVKRQTAAKEKLIRKQTIKWAHSSKRQRNSGQFLDGVDSLFFYLSFGAEGNNLWWMSWQFFFFLKKAHIVYTKNTQTCALYCFDAVNINTTSYRSLLSCEMLFHFVSRYLSLFWWIHQFWWENIFSTECGLHVCRVYGLICILLHAFQWKPLFLDHFMQLSIMQYGTRKHAVL